jgi:hypothetical protein
MAVQHDARLTDNFGENLICRGFYSGAEMRKGDGINVVGVLKKMELMLHSSFPLHS